MVYASPLPGNAAWLGADLRQLDSPEVSAAVERALQSEEIVASHIYPLDSGQHGMMVMRAAHVDGRLWGLVAMELDLQPILSEAGLENIPQLRFMLRDEDQHAVLGDTAVADLRPVVRSVELPGLSWQVLAVPDGGWEKAMRLELWVFRGSAWVIILLLGALSYQVSNRHFRLQRAVSEQTAALSAELSEHQRADAALRESQRAMTTLMSNLPGMAYRCRNDRDWTMEFVSPGCVSLTGYTEADLIWNTAVTYNDLIHPEDQERVWRDVQEALKEGRPFVMEYRLQTASGEEKWVWEQGQGVFENGVLQALEGFVVDITERRRADQALRESEEKYRTLFDSSVEAVLLETLDRNVLDCNAAACKLYGYSREEMVGLSAYDLVPRETKQLIPEMIQRELSEGGAFVRARGKRRDGSTFPSEVSSRVVALGGERHLIVFVRDISERQQREREQSAIATLASALRMAMTRAEVAPIILSQSLSLLNAQGGALLTRDGIQRDGERPVVCTLGSGVWQGWTGMRVEQRDDLLAVPLKSGRPTFNNSISPGESPFKVPAGAVRAVAGVPMVIEGEVNEALWIGRTTPFNEGELHLLSAIADMAGANLHRASLHEEAQRRIQRMGALHQIDMTIKGSLDLTVILNVVLDQVGSQLGADACTIWLYEPDVRLLRLISRQGFQNLTPSRTTLRFGQGYAGQAAMQRHPMTIADLRYRSDANAVENLLEERFVTYHGVPLMAKGELKGVLELFYRAPMSPDQEWLNFMETLAGQAALAVDNARMFENLQRSNLELELAYDTTLEGWARALELRDRETEGHTRRVVEMTLRLVTALGVPEERMVHIRRGALLHDIGKLAIPDQILLKPGPLSEEEWEIMHMHPVYAYQLLSPVPYLRPALDIPYCHHEHWDGSGYPRGLRGEGIPLEARAFAAVDIWDALISERTYRPRWGRDRVRQYIQEQSGLYLDPRVVETFIHLLDSRGFHVEEG